MKAEKSTTCCVCGGNGLPSKGYVNVNNIQGKKPEFKNKLFDCFKCEFCGHSWIPEKSTIELISLKWWNGLFGLGKQIEMYEKYYPNLLKDGEQKILTNKEIEEIWRKETQESKLTDKEFRELYDKATNF